MLLALSAVFLHSASFFSSAFSSGANAQLVRDDCALLSDCEICSSCSFSRQISLSLRSASIFSSCSETEESSCE
jgi:hypothetical protein